LADLVSLWAGKP